jgi:hypothetical protein
VKQVWRVSPELVSRYRLKMMMRPMTPTAAIAQSMPRNRDDKVAVSKDKAAVNLSIATSAVSLGALMKLSFAAFLAAFAI